VVRRAVLDPEILSWTVEAGTLLFLGAMILAAQKRHPPMN